MMGANKILSQQVHFVPLLRPVADAFAGTVVTDEINMSDASAVTFYLYWGVGATGTGTVTVEACDDTSATTTSAIPFKYRRNSATDVFGALQNATTAGFTTTAGSAQTYVIEVDANEMGDSGYKYVRLKWVEVVDSPILGGIHAMVQIAKPRAVTSTVLT
jgi:hypothetical protein